MTKILLGKVAFTDAGAYAAGTTFDRFDFITTDDSCYLSVKDNNVGHALTDTAWWKCIARGTQATEAAKTALQEANKAIEATKNAISAAGLANTKAIEAGKQAGIAEAAGEEARNATEVAESVILAGKAQIASMKAAEQSLMSQALLAPTRMELKYVKRITLGNTVAQKIAVSLFPAYVLPNVIFQQAFYSGDAVYVDPRGNLTVRKTGTATIHVIPAQNTSLAQTIEITVTAPIIRKSGNVMRLLSGSRIRKV